MACGSLLVVERWCRELAVNELRCVLEMRNSIVVELLGVSCTNIVVALGSELALIADLCERVVAWAC